MRHIRFATLLVIICFSSFNTLSGQEADNSFQYRVEAGVTVGSGTYAPLWLTANRHGLGSNRTKSAYVRAGIGYRKEWKNDWMLQTGLDLVGAKNLTGDFIVQQAYADISWKKLRLSIGSKERNGFPLEKDERLSSGMMVEGANARPVPQVRAGIPDYVDFPFTNHWVAVKGHIAYGKFTDGNWQESFSGPGQDFLKDVLYHSKSAMLRFGNKQKFPLEFEIGMIDIGQFGGKKYKKQTDGTVVMVQQFPTGLKSFFKALIPTQKQGDTVEEKLQNVEGNHSGSWNFALTWNADDWKARIYLEHFFEDHSQMFFQYGRWKDGHLGVELTLPQNPVLTRIVWEGLNTTDQTGPILYDGYAGSLSDCQMSGSDNYYTNGQYLGWQHWGLGMGNPLLPGPAYNTDGSIVFKSSRVKAQHIGLSGDPCDEWSYRILASYARHWGTYPVPLDKKRKQFSSLWEVTYTPRWTQGWHIAGALGLDRGNYLGNSTGFCLTLTYER